MDNNSKEGLRTPLHVENAFSAERRAMPHASTSGRDSSMPGEGEGYRSSSGQRKWPARPSRFWDMERQNSSRSSGNFVRQTSYPHQGTPRAGGSWSSRLQPQGSVDLLSQKAQRESLLDLLKQRTGSQELSSQGLTSLLNAPTPGTSSQQMGTLGSTWWPFGGGPDLPLAVPTADPSMLPPIDASQFQPYLQACATRLARFRSVRDSKASEQQTEQDRAFTPGDGLAEALSVVPAMFFKDDFSLARPGTWQEVLSTEDEGQRLARVEGYNNYVDIVESQLGREIAALQEHSTEFFQASSFLEDLRASLYRAYSQVKDMRQRLEQVKLDTATAASNVIASKARKANLEAVMEKLKIVEEIASAQATIELLLPQGDFAGALDVLGSIQATCRAHSVAGLHAFQHLPSQLIDISEAIDSLLSSEFIRATQYHQQPAVITRIASESGSQSSQQLRQPLAGPSAEEGGLTSLEDELMPLVLGLKRTDHLSAAIRIMRSAAAEEVKAGIRDAVEAGLEALPDRGGSGQGLSERLQGLWPQQFLSVLWCVAHTALASVAHVQQVAAAVDGILKSAKAGRSLLSTVKLEFAEVTQAVNEAAHSRWIKLLASRSFLVASLDLGDLKRLFEQSEAFSAAMQHAGCRPILALRNATQVQGRAYLDSRHASSLAQLTQALEGELWSAAGVPTHSQAVIDSILARADIPRAQSAAHHAQANGGTELDKETDRLSLMSHEFRTVASQLLLLQLVADYLQILDILPSLAVEVAHRVVELVKVFNARMCQLVLGAGAMQIAGLKSITAKHLALSCQCVGVLVELHPALLAALTAKLPVSHRALLTPEFNLLLQDLTVHRLEVHNKLVGIMRERLIASLKQLPALAAAWDTASEAGQPSSFSQNLVKQLRTLSTVVRPLLLEEELQGVFSRLGSLYSKNLAEAFSRIEPMGSSWRQQGAADLKFLLTALGELPMPASQREQVTDRLSHVLQTRFLIAETAEQTSAGSPVANQKSKPPPVSVPRKSLADRLSSTKVPFFTRERAPSQEDAAVPDQSDSEGLSAQQAATAAEAPQATAGDLKPEAKPAQASAGKVMSVDLMRSNGVGLATEDLASQGNDTGSTQPQTSAGQVSRQAEGKNASDTAPEALGDSIAGSTAALDSGLKDPLKVGPSLSRRESLSDQEDAEDLPAEARGGAAHMTESRLAAQESFVPEADTSQALRPASSALSDQAAANSGTHVKGSHDHGVVTGLPAAAALEALPSNGVSLRASLLTADSATHSSDLPSTAKQGNAGSMSTALPSSMHEAVPQEAVFNVGQSQLSIAEATMAALSSEADRLELSAAGHANTANELATPSGVSDSLSSSQEPEARAGAASPENPVGPSNIESSQEVLLRESGTELGGSGRVLAEPDPDDLHTMASTRRTQAKSSAIEDMLKSMQEADWSDREESAP